MRHLLWPLLMVSSTLISACDGPSEVRIQSSSRSISDEGVLKVVDGLQCPQTQGVLTRKGSASTDGRRCTYAGPRGSEVELQLVRLDAGSADLILQTIEQDLSKDLPASARQPKDRQGEAPAPSDAEWTDGDSASVELPGLSVDSRGDRSTVRLPGMKIESSGDRSEVRIGGIVIRSDSKSDDNQVNIANASGSRDVTIDSNSKGTRIRALSQGEAIRATYRLVVKADANQPWRSVGYDARGPAGGPIVIATIRSRADNDDRVFDAANELVTLNVGK